ncbi:MAG: transketolase C-terminal domain-containing protein, partial [Thalassotalea sp.]|nr:transketolase C-terminal domain-containing protein [Thalassotalea sp.]
FGGHFHNDNSFAVFRDIPGLIIACPSNGADAVELLRTSVKLAEEQQRVVVFLEPIALYMTKDLHEEGDGLWTFPYQAPSSQISTIEKSETSVHSPIKSEPAELTVSVSGDGTDLCILTYGNGYFLSKQAEKILSEKGINCRVVDLRWLAPLDEKGIIEHAQACKKVLIVDECRKTGSISEALMSLLTEKLNKKSGDVQRICAQDSFIPLGSAAYHVLPSKDDIVNLASEMCSSDTQEKA